MELNLGFLASGNGSNFRAIVLNINEGSLEAKARVLISNNPDAGVLRSAQSLDFPSYCLNRSALEGFPDVDEAIIGILRRHDVNLVLLCGYTGKLGDKVVDAFPNRILNIHPALLPKYGGKGMYGHHVHDAVIASSDTETGVTVHLVDKEYDHGRILAQARVPRYEADTSQTLGERVLRFEHVIYSQVLRDIQKGIMELD
jgi:phosphoribosylglycinamide formyltransferase-1